MCIANIIIVYASIDLSRSWVLYMYLPPKKKHQIKFQGHALDLPRCQGCKSYWLQDYTIFAEIKEMDTSCAKYLLDIGFDHV